MPTKRCGSARIPAQLETELHAARSIRTQVTGAARYNSVERLADPEYIAAQERRARREAQEAEFQARKTAFESLPEHVKLRMERERAKQANEGRSLSLFSLRTTAAHLQAALTVACPQCGAAPHSYCTSEVRGVCGARWNRAAGASVDALVGAVA